MKFYPQSDTMTGQVKFAGEHLYFNACVATYLNKTVTSVI